MVNLQHDCHRGKCETSGTQILHQEREATTRSRTVIKHSDDTHFIVNTQSLHNYQHISRAIPSNLHGSSFNVVDPVGLRNQASAILRDKKQQQVEARKALSMATVMGRSEIPSVRLGDEEPIPDSTARAEADSAPLEHHTDSAPVGPCVQEDSHAPIEQHVSDQDTPLPSSHYPAGLPVFLQSAAGTSTQPHGASTTAIPTTLYVTELQPSDLKLTIS